MDFGKLAPWNWFKKEEEGSGMVPAQRSQEHSTFPLSIYNIQREFDRFFDSLKHGLDREWPKDSLLKMDWFKPSLDLVSDDKEYSIKIELPGMDTKDISIEYSHNTLKITGEKRQEHKEDSKDFHRIERSYGSFQRILDLPEDSDTENIVSNYKDGLLHIVIPRKTLAHKDSKKIDINIK